MNDFFSTGSCNLHVVHGALKSITETTKWNLKAIMKASYQIVNDSPGRREDFFDLLGGCSLGGANIQDRAATKRLTESLESRGINTVYNITFPEIMQFVPIVVRKYSFP